MATKPSIVFCHGIWADGSSFSKVIPALQARQFFFKEVIQSHDYDGKAKLREAAVAFMGRFQLHFSKVSPIVGNSLLQVAFPWKPRNPAGFDVSWAWASVLR
jgi:hypothetical protein